MDVLLLLLCPQRKYNTDLRQHNKYIITFGPKYVLFGKMRKMHITRNRKIRDFVETFLPVLGSRP